MVHSTCQNRIVVFLKNDHIVLNANVEGRIDRSGGLVPLKIDDRLEPLPENRPSLSGPPDAEIEISPLECRTVLAIYILIEQKSIVPRFVTIDAS